MKIRILLFLFLLTLLTTNHVNAGRFSFGSLSPSMSQDFSQSLSMLDLWDGIIYDFCSAFGRYGSFSGGHTIRSNPFYGYGPLLNRAGPPPNTAGPPPNRDRPPPNINGPSLNRAGPPPNRDGPLPNRARLLPNRAGPLPKIDGLPPNRAGLSPNIDGPPPNRAGPPPNRVRLLLNRAGPLPKIDGLPPNRAGLPPNRAGPPSNIDEPPPNRVGPPLNRAGPPPNRVGPPLNRAGPLPNTDGTLSSGSTTGSYLTGYRTSSGQTAHQQNKNLSMSLLQAEGRGARRPSAPYESQAGKPPVHYSPRYKISDSELWNLTEELFAKQDINVSRYVTVYLQKKSENLTVAMHSPLIHAEKEVYSYPTIMAVRALYDSYEHNSTVKENRTPEKRKEVDLLLNVFLNTNLMVRAMKWLSERGFIDPGNSERKDILRHIWFSQFDGATSGFERVFMSERNGTDLLGVQDWIYYEYQESKNRINYMGYTDTLKLGDSASLVKLNFKMDDIVRLNATIFVGTLPELEMSLYTICFYARPNDLCPVSLGGTKFNIFTHSFRYYGRDLIDLALPMF